MTWIINEWARPKKKDRERRYNTSETLVIWSNGQYPNHRADFGIPTVTCPTRNHITGNQHDTYITRRTS